MPVVLCTEATVTRQQLHLEGKESTTLRCSKLGTSDKLAAGPAGMASFEMLLSRGRSITGV